MFKYSSFIIIIYYGFSFFNVSFNGSFPFCHNSIKMMFLSENFPRFFAPDIVPITRKFSPWHLLSRRFAHRSLNIPVQVELTLKSLHIYKKFNPRRGRRAGKNLFSNSSRIKNINVLNFGHKNFPLSQVNQHKLKLPYKYLVSIQLQKSFYHLPSILYTNSRSLGNKFDQATLEINFHNPDIAIFVETWLTPADSNAFCVNGYQHHHVFRDREDKSLGGGLSVYLKDKFTTHYTKTPENSKIEAITIVFRSTYIPRNIAWFALIVLYFPPNELNNFNRIVSDYILSEIDRLLSVNTRANIYVIGDFNNLNTYGLQKLHKFKQLIKSPTRGTNILDKCFVNIDFQYNVLTFPPLDNSDHALIFLSPKFQKTQQQDKTIISFRPKKQSNKVSMAKVLADHSWRDWSLIDNIDLATNIFHDFIYDIYDICFPKTTKIIYERNPKWCNKIVLDLLKQRNLIDYKNCSNNPLFHTLNKNIKSEIKKAKAHYLNSICRNNGHLNQSYFKFINSLSNSNTPNKSIVFPNATQFETLSLILNFFSNLSNSHPPIDKDMFMNYHTTSAVPPIEDFQTYQYLMHINTNSAVAPDSIPNFIYKEFAAFLTSPITRLINLSLSTKTCPELWKRSFLIPIPKIKTPLSPDDIRPISVSSMIPKILEKHIINNIFNLINPKLDKFQFGGMPGKSTCQYLVIYLHKTLQHLENSNSSVYSLMLDFKKAYDNVSHNILIQKLINLHIPDNALRWIISFLSNRMQILKHSFPHQVLSFEANNGLPQGAVMGTFLFAILINDFARDIGERLKYVDDVTVSCHLPNVDQLTPQLMVDQIIRDSSTISIPLNPLKSSFMVHCFGKSHIPIKLRMNDADLIRVDCVKLLGIYVQSDLKWNYNVDHIISKTNKSLFIIYKLKQHGAPHKILIQAYKMYIRPKLEYCAPVWHSSLTAVQSMQIESIQKRVLHIVLGRSYVSYQTSLSMFKLDTLEVRRTQLTLQFSTNFFKNFPQFLPPTFFQTSSKATRNSSKFNLPYSRTSRFAKSPINFMIRLLNNQHN